MIHRAPVQDTKIQPWDDLSSPLLPPPVAKPSFPRTELDDLPDYSENYLSN